MRRDNWTRFSWDLTQLPPPGLGAPEHYRVLPAEEGDEQEIRRAIATSFVLDSSWNPELQEMSELIDQWLEGAFAPESGLHAGLVLKHGQRIIGATMLSLDPESEYHLAPGPCILMEYRNRGFAALLMESALHLLAEAGLRRASALAKRSSVVARFLYPKFGGVESARPVSPLLAA